MSPEKKPSSDAEKLDKIYDAMFVGDGKVGGAPGLIEATNALRTDVAELKGAQNKTADRAWSLGLGALAGIVASWFRQSQ